MKERRNMDREIPKHAAAADDRRAYENFQLYVFLWMCGYGKREKKLLRIYVVPSTWTTSSVTSSVCVCDVAFFGAFHFSSFRRERVEQEKEGDTQHTLTLNKAEEKPNTIPLN